MAPRASPALTFPDPALLDGEAADELIEGLEDDSDDDDDDDDDVGTEVGAALLVRAETSSSRFVQIANEDAEVMELADGDDSPRWPAFRLGPTLPAKVPGSRFEEPTVPLSPEEATVPMPPDGAQAPRKRTAGPAPWAVMAGSAGALGATAVIGVALLAVAGIGLAWRAANREEVVAPVPVVVVATPPVAAPPAPPVEVAAPPAEPAVEVVVEAPVVRPAARRAPKPAPVAPVAPPPVVEVAPVAPPPVAAEAPPPPPKRGLFKRKKDE